MDRMAWEVTHSPELRDFVAAWESLRTHAYQDVAGVWTIGYGRTQDVQPGDTCTQDQAAEWLDETLTDFGKQLQRYMTREPSQQQYDALLSLAYNCGIEAIGDSGVMARFNAHLDQECADRMLMWNRSGGREWHGLTKRRRGERRIYLLGIYDARP